MGSSLMRLRGDQVTAEALAKVAGIGAIGVAALALYFWHTAFARLLAAMQATTIRESALAQLTSQLRSYSKLALAVLVAAIGLQIVELILKTRTSEHPVKLRISPAREIIPHATPIVHFNGQELPDTGNLQYSASIAGNSNFEIDLQGVRAALDRAMNHTNQLQNQLDRAKSVGKPTQSGFDLNSGR